MQISSRILGSVLIPPIPLSLLPKTLDKGATVRMGSVVIPPFPLSLIPKDLDKGATV